MLRDPFVKERPVFGICEFIYLLFSSYGDLMDDMKS
jgi:hypothetical protein